MTDLVGELGRISSGLAVPLAVGMVAVGREPIAGIAVALNTGTVAVEANEITGVGRAMLSCGSVTAFGEKAGGDSVSGEARCGMGMKGPAPVWIGMGVGGSLGRPIWALAATAALIASSLCARKFSKWFKR